MRRERTANHTEEFFTTPQGNPNGVRTGTACSPQIKGFTLLELSLVVIIMALLAGAALRYATALIDANNIASLNATLDAIDAAMMNYRIANNRIPCPANISAYGENNANFGIEAGTTSGTGTGECVTGGTTPAANYENTGTDPDAAGGSDANFGGAKDPNYDTASNSQIEAGGVPTKTLRLPDKYAYDPWGRKILYVVDKRLTFANAFSTYSAITLGAGSAGEIVIKQTNIGNNTTTSPNILQYATTYSAVYALVSFGKNGHGGYVRNLNSTPVIFNAGSHNADELQNCHCTNAAAAGTFDRIFVQQSKNNSTTTGNLIDVFDDIVRYKTRTEMAIPSELK